MNIALILASGKGKRFDQNYPKQLYKLNGRSLLEYSLDISEELDAIDLSLIVIDPAYNKVYKDIIKKYKKPVELCTGGSTRQKSVYNGLKHIKAFVNPPERTRVLIHDSARPFARNVFVRVLEKLKSEDAVVPVINSKDTVYVISNHQVTDIPCRDSLFKVQTPQGFSFFLILECHKISDREQQLPFTDDGSLYYRIKGKSPTVVDGDQMNLKITDKKDLLIAESYLAKENGR